MGGLYSQRRARVGRPHSGYSRHARRIDTKHANARYKAQQGRQVVMTISTRENTPEWRWFCSFEKRKGSSVSKQARTSLRKMLEGEDMGTTVEGLARSLKARILELECRDREIRELRHALGLHFENPDPKCEGCQ